MLSKDLRIKFLVWIYEWNFIWEKFEAKIWKKNYWQMEKNLKKKFWKTFDEDKTQKQKTK